MVELITLGLIGVIFLIYSVVYSRKRKVIYTINTPKFIVLDDRYFNLQLKISILNSIILVIGGSISQFFYNKSTILFGTILIFWIINYCLKWIAINKKYVQIENKNKLK